LGSWMVSQPILSMRQFDILLNKARGPGQKS
jgi:hypothetical protein